RACGCRGGEAMFIVRRAAARGGGAAHPGSHRPPSAIDDPDPVCDALTGGARLTRISSGGASEPIARDSSEGLAFVGPCRRRRRATTGRSAT
ncbi:MAG: hypothetical protein ACRDWE_05475, partial [Acidimicrobiales bacterium]